MACKEFASANESMHMKNYTLLSASALLFLATSILASAGVYDHKVKSIDGKDVDLATYKGKVSLMVNVASHCGNTRQYTNLENLHQKFAEKGLAIIGFPANEFGAQEPGTNEEIAKFCTDKYGVKFDMMSKIVVKGEGIDPLYKELTDPDSKFGGKIGWNFEKFLVNKNGEVIARFKPRTSPEDPEVITAIEKALAE